MGQLYIIKKIETQVVFSPYFFPTIFFAYSKFNKFFLFCPGLREKEEQRKNTK